MTTWSDLARQAPRITAIFHRRHAATGRLCLLATLRADGFPRISPMEPRFFEDRLWIAGMPDTTKFADLDRDPRFCLHTATVDTHVSDGDAKLWGVVRDETDRGVRERFLDDLYADIGIDMRGHAIDHLYYADISAASSVEVGGGHMDVTLWKAGAAERVVRKH